MAADFRQFDKDGFPVPPRFSDLKYHDDDQPSARPKASLRTKRLVMLAILVGIVLPIVLGPRILSAGRDLLAQWLFSRAQQRFGQGDNVGALADLNRAIDWNPNAWMLYIFRADVRRAENDLAGSIEDLNTAIDRNHRAWAAYLLRAAVQQKLDKLKESLADYSNAIRLLTDGRNEFVHWQLQILPRYIMLAEAHAGRSWIYVRLGKAGEALDDATKAVEIAPSAEMLNTRAYARAVLKTELKEGLSDIDRALTQQRREVELQRSREAEFLDTRGYLLHQLGRDAEALSVMDRAIAQSERGDRNALNQRDQTEFDHSLAVMYHHRGEIYRELGQKDKADVDLRRGENLGYDPAHGVF